MVGDSQISQDKPAENFHAAFFGGVGGRTEAPGKITVESVFCTVTARLLPRGICLDACDDLFIEDEAIEELLPFFG